MIRMVKNELAKLFASKKIGLLLLLLVGVNALLFYRESSGEKSYDAYSAAAYKSLWNDMEQQGDAAGEFLAELLERLSDYKNVLFGIAEKNADYTLRYTETIWSEEALYREVQQEYDAAVSYERHKEEIRQAAERIMVLSVFSDKDSFSYRNAALIKERFAALTIGKTAPIPSKGIRLATENSFTDICVLVALFGCVLLLFTREKEEEVVDFMKTTYRGRSAWVTAKLTVLLLMALILELLLYAGNFLLAEGIYGIYGLSMPVQSLYGFENCVLEVTVAEYLGCYLLVKFLAYSVAVLLLALPAIVCSRAGGVYAWVMAAAGTFGVCYYGISDTSYMSNLKYINPVAFLHTDFLLRTYKNLNVFSCPVYYLGLFLTLAVVLCVALFAGNVALFANARMKIRKGGLFAALRRKVKVTVRFGQSVSVARQEAYKLFIGGKWLVVLLAYLLFAVASYTPQRMVFFDLDEYYYYLYMTKLTGEQTEEKWAYLAEEEKRLAELKEKQWTEQNAGVLEQISNELKREKAFSQIMSHAEYLKETEDGWFFFDKGYRLLTGDSIAGKTDCILAMKAVLIVILCASYTFSIEYQTGMNRLLSVTRYGRGKSRRNKLGYTALLTTLVFAITYLPYYYRVLKAYGTEALLAPANSMEHLKMLPAGLSVAAFLLLLLLTRYVGLLVAAGILSALSVRTKSYSITLLLGVGIFLAPLLLYFINLDWMEPVLFNPLFLGNYVS